MRRRIALAVIPAALCMVLGSTVPASAAPGPASSTILSGAAEVPGPGDPNGVGVAVATPQPGQSRVCIDIRYRNIDPPTGAHIHEAPPGVAGPIVVDFTPFIATSPAGRIRGCTTTTPELAADIAANPSDYYVNVHNPAFPAGAIRGQLRG